MSDSYISLDERIRRMKEGAATSNDAALIGFTNIAEGEVLTNLIDDVDATYQLLGKAEMWLDEAYGGDDDDKFKYFCKCMQSMYEEIMSEVKGSGDMLIQNEYGVRLIDGVVLLAYCLYQHISNKKSKFFLDFNMNLGDFWMAAIYSCKRKDGTLDRARLEQIKEMRASFMQGRNRSTPYRQAIKELLEEYEGYIEIFKRIENTVKYSDIVIDCLDRQAELFAELDAQECDFSDEEADEKIIYTGNTFDCVEALCGSFIMDDEPVEDCVQEENPEDREWFEDDVMKDTAPEYYYLYKARDEEIEKVTYDGECHKGDFNKLIFDNEGFGSEALGEMREEIGYMTFAELFDDLVASKEFKNSVIGIEKIIEQLYVLIVKPFSTMVKR